MKKLSTPAILLLIVLGIGFIGWFISLFDKKLPDRPDIVQPVQEVVFNSDYDGSVRQAEKYLKLNLKDPDSYQSVQWFKVFKLTPDQMHGVDGLENAAFMVKHQYKAKNIYGGYEVYMSTFFFNSSGNVILMRDN